MRNRSKAAGSLGHYGQRKVDEGVNVPSNVKCGDLYRELSRVAWSLRVSLCGDRFSIRRDEHRTSVDRINVLEVRHG